MCAFRWAELNVSSTDFGNSGPDNHSYAQNGKAHSIFTVLQAAKQLLAEITSYFRTEKTKMERN